MWSDFPQMPGLALGLRESIGWEPVLWLGWGHLREPVAEAFPETPWQWLGDSWFGRPITGVSTSQPSALNEEVWARLQQYLPRLMNQMHRFGPPDVFLYDEREAFARDLLLRWHEVLTSTGVEVAFWEESPSVPFSYAAYVVCQELGIKTVVLIPTRVWGLSLLKEQIEDPPLSLDEAYRRCPQDGGGGLAANVQEAVSSVTGHDVFLHRTEVALADREQDHRGRSAESAPAQKQNPLPTSASVKDRALAALRERGIRGLVAPVILKLPFVPVAYRWLRRKDPVYVWFKVAGARIDAEHGTKVDEQRYNVKSRSIKRQLRDDYRRRCLAPDLENDRYVYYPLHYRPERTSNPDGGVFYDQFIPLAMISEALPDGWKLYVKEHEVQFFETMAGECGRTKEYYDDIARLRGVQFIAAEVSSKDLVLHSQAVASMTGTVCWEAALLGKPAMYFGFPWYQGCPGTTRVRSGDEVSAVLSDLSSAVASEKELHAWHVALSEAGFPYEFNAWQAEPGCFSDQEQNDGLRAALEWWHHNRFAVSE